MLTERREADRPDKFSSFVVFLRPENQIKFVTVLFLHVCCEINTWRQGRRKWSQHLYVQCWFSRSSKCCMDQNKFVKGLLFRWWLDEYFIVSYEKFISFSWYTPPIKKKLKIESDQTAQTGSMFSLHSRDSRTPVQQTVVLSLCCFTELNMCVLWSWS